MSQNDDSRAKTIHRPTPTAHCTMHMMVTLHTAHMPQKTPTTHQAVERGLFAYDKPVASYWPEFGQNLKAEILVEDMLR